MSYFSSIKFVLPKTEPLYLHSDSVFRCHNWNTESCQSGRMGLIRNQKYSQGYRGFESLALCQIAKSQ